MISPDHFVFSYAERLQAVSSYLRRYGWKRQVILGLKWFVIATAVFQTGSARANTLAEYAMGVDGTSDLAQAEKAWLQCLKDHQYQFGGSVWSIGPKGQMRASHNNCPSQIQSAGRALADQERAAGRSVSVGKIKELLKLSEKRVRTTYTEYLANRIEPPLKPSLSKGLEAFNLGDYDAAYAYWLPKAREGNAAAQNNMGILYERGLTSRAPQSDERAADWFLLASRQGEVEAMRNLARVQARLGNIEASNSWLAQARTSEQQAGVQQQQALGALGYAVGCAVAGGCGTPTRVFTEENPRPAALPATQRQAVRCHNDPILKDLWGNPEIRCR